MMKTKFILEFLGLDDDVEEESEVSNKEVFEAEMREVLTELAAEHADTDEYKQAVNNLKTLCEAYHEYEEGKAESASVSTEADSARRREMIKAMDTIIRCLGISLGAGMTVFWFLAEQERPIPIRLSRSISDLLTIKI